MKKKKLDPISELLLEHMLNSIKAEYRTAHDRGRDPCTSNVIDEFKNRIRDTDIPTLTDQEIATLMERVLYCHPFIPVRAKHKLLKVSPELAGWARQKGRR